MPIEGENWLVRVAIDAFSAMSRQAALISMAA